MARRSTPIGLLAVLVVVTIGVVVARRRSYFHGKLLDADDLSEEQQFRRCRRRLR